MIALMLAWMTDSFGDDLPDPFGNSDPGFDPFNDNPAESALRFFAPFIIFVVIALAVFIYFGRRAAKRDKARIAGLQAWTQQRDYSFSAEEPDLARTYPKLPSESGGRRLRFRNVIRGRLAGLPLTAFDYSYETTSTSTSASNADGTGGGTTTSTTTHYLQVVAVDVPAGWPSVRVSPQGLGSKLAVMFGRQDVKVGHDGFDRAFRVRAQDEEAARRLLAPMAPALLVRTDQEFWVDGRTVLALRRGTLEHTDLDIWLGQLKVVLAQAPIQDR